MKTKLSFAIPLAVAVFLLASMKGTAQNVSDQARIIVHPTVGLGSNWYLAGWAIGNVRSKLPDNLNLIGGMGYKKPKWWLEGMIWRQLNSQGGHLALDFRFQGQISRRAKLYVELGPFLSRPALYDFVIFEYKIIQSLNLGVETENLHRAGSDSLGAGPRISHPLISFGKLQVNLAATYRFHRGEPNVLRVYLTNTLRF